MQPPPPPPQASTAGNQGLETGLKSASTNIGRGCSFRATATRKRLRLNRTSAYSLKRGSARIKGRTHVWVPGPGQKFRGGGRALHLCCGVGVLGRLVGLGFRFGFVFRDLFVESVSTVTLLSSLSSVPSKIPAQQRGWSNKQQQQRSLIKIGSLEQH